jgi:hypothetical protein
MVVLEEKMVKDNNRIIQIKVIYNNNSNNNCLNNNKQIQQQ